MTEEKKNPFLKMTCDAVRLDHERIVLILHGELGLTEWV